METKIYQAIKLDPDFVIERGSYEDYALFYSKVVAELLDSGIQGYVKISTDDGKHTVYRKILARNAVKSDQIALGDRTRKELGIGSSNSKVYVSKSTFLKYYLHNSDKSIRLSSIITAVGIICTIIGALISILSLFVEFPIICN